MASLFQLDRGCRSASAFRAKWLRRYRIELSLTQLRLVFCRPTG